MTFDNPRHIVIAEFRDDVVIVTPRSRYGARGIAADAITVTSTMLEHPETARLLADCEPALATAPRRPEGAWDAMLAAEIEAARHVLEDAEPDPSPDAVCAALETLADRGPVSSLDARSLRLAAAIVRRAVQHGQ